MLFDVPAFSMAGYRDSAFCPFICQSVNICVNPNFNLNVQVLFPNDDIGISLHLGMTTQTAVSIVSIFDLNLYYTAL